MKNLESKLFAYCFLSGLGGLVPCYANGVDRFRINL